ncbi:MAG: NUDIX hydrolase [Armatimonadaceae bacterium]
MIPYKFCPFCQTVLEARRIPDPGPVRRVCPSCRFIQWGNSKPTASGIVVNDRGFILLAKRGIEPFRGMWDIPGGFLEAGEHPEDGVRRELFEETGLTVAVTALIGVYMDTYGPAPSEDTLNLYYACRMESGSIQADDDAEELRWCAPDHLPGPLAFVNAQQALADWLAQPSPRRDTISG